MGLAAVLGYILGGAVGWLVAYILYPSSHLIQLLAAGFLGGTVGTVASAVVWFMLPPAVRVAARASKTGVLIVAVGLDKKLRLLPGKTDGFVIRPVDKPYRDKYVWAADGESAYPVHRGKGIQAIITFMGYPFPLEVRKAAAVGRFREKGFKSIEDLKTAVELPSAEEVEARIRELKETRASVESMDEGEVERIYNTGKDQLLAEIGKEIERLERVRELVRQYGGGGSLAVNVDGATVKASDLISYLVWRHHPAELERIVKAETNAVLARMSAIDWIKQLMPVIILSGMMVLAVLAAIYMLSHGGAPASPAAPAQGPGPGPVRIGGGVG